MKATRNEKIKNIQIFKEYYFQLAPVIDKSYNNHGLVSGMLTITEMCSRNPNVIENHNLSECATLLKNQLDEHCKQIPTEFMLDKIEVKELVGLGRYSRIHKAFIRDNTQKAALKQFKNQAKQARNIFKERDILICLKSSDRIIDIYAAFHDVDPFIVLQLCLGDIGRLTGKLEKHALRFSVQLAEGITWIHQKKIIHCDIRLENILLNDKNNVVITDFGSAIVLEKDCDFVQLPKDMVHLGHPGYLDERSLRDRIYSRRTDIWSLLCVAFHMKTGRFFVKYNADQVSIEEYKNVFERGRINNWLTEYLDPTKIPEGVKCTFLRSRLTQAGSYFKIFLALFESDDGMLAHDWINLECVQKLLIEEGLDTPIAINTCVNMITNEQQLSSTHETFEKLEKNSEIVAVANFSTFEYNENNDQRSIQLRTTIGSHDVTTICNFIRESGRHDAFIESLTKHDPIVMREFIYITGTHFNKSAAEISNAIRKVTFANSLNNNITKTPAITDVAKCNIRDKSLPDGNRLMPAVGDNECVLRADCEASIGNNLMLHQNFVVHEKTNVQIIDKVTTQAEKADSPTPQPKNQVYKQTASMDVEEYNKNDCYMDFDKFALPTSITQEVQKIGAILFNNDEENIPSAKETNFTEVTKDNAGWLITHEDTAEASENSKEVQTVSERVNTISADENVNHNFKNKSLNLKEYQNSQDASKRSKCQDDDSGSSGSVVNEHVTPRKKAMSVRTKNVVKINHLEKIVLSSEDKSENSLSDYNCIKEKKKTKSTKNDSCLDEIFDNVQSVRKRKEVKKSKSKETESSSDGVSDTGLSYCKRQKNHKQKLKAKKRDLNSQGNFHNVISRQKHKKKAMKKPMSSKCGSSSQEDSDSCLSDCISKMKKKQSESKKEVSSSDDSTNVPAAYKRKREEQNNKLVRNTSSPDRVIPSTKFKLKQCVVRLSQLEPNSLAEVPLPTARRPVFDNDDDKEEVKPHSSITTAVSKKRSIKRRKI